MNKEQSEVEREYNYNGLPSKLMNLLCRGLFARIEEERIGNWDILSLYLARACGVIENKFHIIPKTDSPEKWVEQIDTEDNKATHIIGLKLKWREQK